MKIKKNSLESNDNAPDSRLIVRAIKIIEAVSLCQTPVGVQQIGTMTGLHPTTVFRIVRTLCKYGWLVQDSDTKYNLGMSVYSVGCQFNLVNDLKEISFYYMQKLSDSTGQSVSLMIRENNMGFLIQKTYGKNAFSRVSIIGSKIPLYITACGKVLMSGVTDTLLKLIADSFDYHQYTPNSIHDRNVLLEQIKTVRETGYAMEHQESMWGVYCVAVPIYDELGQIIAALSITSLIDYLKNRDEYVTALKKTAPKITKDLIAYRTERGFISTMVQPKRYE
jgi:IclR family KDG regulon transcriptional repressor